MIRIGSGGNNRLGTAIRPFLAAKPYTNLVLSTSPIAYWVADDSANPIIDRVNANQNGTATAGLTLASGTAPDGSACPLWDAAGDYVNIYTATLNTSFNRSTLSVVLWINADAGLWTSGTTHVFINIGVNNNNRVRISKTNNNNRLSFEYTAGGVIRSRTYDFASSPTDWVCLGLTVSTAADALIGYVDGVATAPLGTLGVFVADPLTNTLCVIGARGTDGISNHLGYLAHCILYDRAISPGSMLRLATKI